MTNSHQQLVNTKRWVIKIGSALLTRVGEGLDLERVQWLSGEIAILRAQGKEVVLVTSGSVAAGMQQLGWTKDRMPYTYYNQRPVLAKWV